MVTLKNLTIYTEDKVIKNGYITFDKTILKIGEGDVNGEDMGGKILIPGFIDQHIHGVKGYDIMDASHEALDAFCKYLPKEGTTAYYATTMTASKEAIINALNAVATYNAQGKIGAELLGVHLEGPFISEIYKGAQNKEHIQAVSFQLMDEFIKASNNTIKHITLAPELKDSEAFINYLTNQNIVVSIGHSDASEDDVKNALNQGALCFTHAFNAMRHLHHRDIGVVGMMLSDSSSYAELIADMIHVNPSAMKLLYQVKTSDKLILITDAMRAKQLSSGNYDLGGQSVTVKNNQARLKDGTLAGSVLEFIDGVKNIQKSLDLSINELIKMASLNPAKLHNIDHKKGSIKLNKDADLLVIDHDFNIHRTYTLGKKAYQLD
ncbi:MAG: N-acetylglucosamine-6-phosphate deacetylase [Candidatus Izemoplasmataceae bacterium]